MGRRGGFWTSGGVGALAGVLAVVAANVVEAVIGRELPFFPADLAIALAVGAVLGALVLAARTFLSRRGRGRGAARGVRPPGGGEEQRDRTARTRARGRGRGVAPEAVGHRYLARVHARGLRPGAARTGASGRERGVGRPRVIRVLGAPRALPAVPRRTPGRCPAPPGVVPLAPLYRPFPPVQDRRATVRAWRLRAGVRRAVPVDLTGPLRAACPRSR